MAVKILVVDDEPEMKPLIELRFRRQIRQGKFHFLFSMGGGEALEILANDEDIDIILCDINMPGMDGLTLLSKLTNSYPTLRVVMVSAYGDMSNIRRAMNLGAYDFVVKPIDFSDLEATIDKTIIEVELIKRAKITKELLQKNEELKKLDHLKSQFFTNISHEFRTPLTAILGIADQMRQSPDQWLSKGLTMIYRNGSHLLQLINQLLDLRELESGKLELHLIQNNIIPFISYLLESFEASINRKELAFKANYLKETILMDYDPDKVMSIISNLVSNAIKYTPKGGSVEVEVGVIEEKFQFKIKDSGEGIDAEHLPFIFDRYYKVKKANGQQWAPSNNYATGIGLSLVKELVEKMNGQIEVESTLSKGTAFILKIPIRNEAKFIDAPPASTFTHMNAWEVEDTPPSEMLGQVAANGHEEVAKPHLLIVEDNIDIVRFLTAALEGQYLVDVAWDGQAGIEKAIEVVPDIILSDVMMPEKNGFELCMQLKNDLRTSHIPIILLTAAADEEAKLKGLEMGADAFLPKPVNQKELFIRLKKLLELRKILQEKYSSVEKIPGNKESVATKEDAFLIGLRQLIENHIDNEKFGIPDICQLMAVSRTQLHRKIKALTNKSTSLFIRSVRLHKAKDLLKTTDLNIAQVAFEVGYSDPKYFSTVFLEEFGQRPTVYRN